MRFLYLKIILVIEKDRCVFHSGLCYLCYSVLMS